LAIYRVHGRIENDDINTGGGGRERREKGSKEGVRTQDELQHQSVRKLAEERQRAEWRSRK
jgi:hypothetical protein